MTSRYRYRDRYRYRVPVRRELYGNTARRLYGTYS